MEQQLQKPLKDVRFEICERVYIDEVNENIFALTETELTPHIKMVMHEGEIQLVGYLQLKLSYKDSGRFLMQHEYQHNIPVEIKIPASRVEDAYLLDADIQNFNVEVIGSRNVNVTGVLVVYEKEREAMPDKVKLPKEVANAIEKIREIKATNWDIVYTFAWDTKNGYPELVTFAHAKLDTLMQALVNGYEIEETPEDKVRRYYERCTVEGHEWERTHPHANSGNPYFTEMQGIAKTLGILNIKIEGVNA